MIGIVDNDMGNLRSVASAVAQNGYEAKVTASPDEVEGFTHLILPGVGAFHRAMRKLSETGMGEAVRAFAASSRPVLGICLGMQLLASSGEEGEETEGLDLIPGRVRRLSGEGGLPLPHVGWNAARFRRGHRVFDGVKPGRDYYFVHSFVLDTREPDCAVAQTEYGETFCSIAARGNVIGFQFHPEKSQANGLRLIENFCAWDGRC